MTKNKLFKVELKNYKGDVYVIANGYDEAAEKALQIRNSPDYDSNEDDLDDELDKIEGKKPVYKVRSIELLTENLTGILNFSLKLPSK